MSVTTKMHFKGISDTCRHLVWIKGIDTIKVNLALIGILLQNFRWQSLSVQIRSDSDHKINLN